MKKLLFAVLGISIVSAVFFGFTLLKDDSAPVMVQSGGDISESSTSPEITETADFLNKPALVIGNKDAPVTIIEYADFKCPACNKFHREAGKEIRENYIDSGRVKIEFRTYPFIAPDSGLAARGAYCAEEQNSFEQYHDKVFDYLWETYYRSNPRSAYEETLTAQELTDVMRSNLGDPVGFSECVKSDRMNSFIDADLLLAAEHEINGAPGFRIGSQSIIGPQNYTTFQTLLDIQLKQ
jgi:protein-disulfide isomerase